MSVQVSENRVPVATSWHVFWQLLKAKKIEESITAKRIQIAKGPTGVVDEVAVATVCDDFGRVGTACVHFGDTINTFAEHQKKRRHSIDKQHTRDLGIC